MVNNTPSHLAVRPVARRTVTVGLVIEEILVDFFRVHAKVILGGISSYFFFPPFFFVGLACLKGIDGPITFRPVGTVLRELATMTTSLGIVKYDLSEFGFSFISLISL